VLHGCNLPRSIGAATHHALEGASRLCHLRARSGVRTSARHRSRIGS